MTSSCLTHVRDGSEECLQGLKPASSLALMSELKLRPPKEVCGAASGANFRRRIPGAKARAGWRLIAGLKPHASTVWLAPGLKLRPTIARLVTTALGPCALSEQRLRSSGAEARYDLELMSWLKATTYKDFGVVTDSHRIATENA